MELKDLSNTALEIFLSDQIRKLCTSKAFDAIDIKRFYLLTIIE